MSDWFSVWNLIRCSGFLAFYFMTVSLALGLCKSFPMLKKKKGLILQFHQTSGWYGLLTIIFHIILIWQDQYVPYSLTEILLPLTAKNEVIVSSLGTLSFYLFFLVTISSDFFIKKLGLKLWKKIHLVVIPAWVLMLIHGLFIGSDTDKPWAMFLYGGASSILIVLGLIRFLDSVTSRQQADRPVSVKKRQTP
jgi:sulfoxide reductase heme-binding subunit YedZ